MIIKASGRSALILATGIFVCFAGPSQAAPSEDTAAASSDSEKTTGAPVALNKDARSRHSKKHSQRKSDKTALKSSAAKNASFVADAAGTGSTAIPPSIANANAQLAFTEPPPGSARAMSAKASTMLLAAADKQTDTRSVAETQVVAADQLNDLDRALQESKSAAPTTAPPLAMASAEPRTAPVAASSREESTWDQTSLIGKIFMAFGALLTMASAARMFMA